MRLVCLHFVVWVVLVLVKFLSLLNIISEQHLSSATNENAFNLQESISFFHNLADLVVVHTTVLFP